MPSRRLASLAAALLVPAALVFAASQSSAAQPPGCTVTLEPGAPVAATIAAAAPGETVCLAPGEHQMAALSRVPTGVTLRGESRGVTLASRDGVTLDLDGARAFTLANVSIRSADGTGVRVRGGGSVTLRGVRVDEAAVAVLVDEGSSALLSDVSVRRALDAGVVVRGGSSLRAERLLLADAETGVAVLGDGARASLSESRIAGGAGPAAFAGAPPCAEPAIGSTVAPACFREGEAAAGAGALLVLDGVTIEDGDGAGIVLHHGARAEVRRSRVYARALGGMLAWGAEALVSDSVFEGNSGFGVELRAFPEPGAAAATPAVATIERSTVRFTRALGGGLLGDGIAVRGSSLRLTGSGVTANAGNGVLLQRGAAAEIDASRFLDNERAAVCVTADARALLVDSTLTGNGTDEVVLCGPAPLVGEAPR